VKPPQRLCRGRLTDLNLGLCQRTVKSLSIHQDARNISDTSASANGAAAGSINRYFGTARAPRPQRSAYSSLCCGFSSPGQHSCEKGP
jgi:hypothetical protein